MVGLRLLGKIFTGKKAVAVAEAAGTLAKAAGKGEAKSATIVEGAVKQIAAPVEKTTADAIKAATAPQITIKQVAKPTEKGLAAGVEQGAKNLTPKQPTKYEAKLKQFFPNGSELVTDIEKLGLPPEAQAVIKDAKLSSIVRNQNKVYIYAQKGDGRLVCSAFTPGAVKSTYTSVTYPDSRVVTRQVKDGIVTITKRDSSGRIISESTCEKENGIKVIKERLFKDNDEVAGKIRTFEKAQKSVDSADKSIIETRKEYSVPMGTEATSKIKYTPKEEPKQIGKVLYGAY